MMEFYVFIFAAVYIVFAVVLFLNDETDFALIWLLFMPMAFIYLEATVGAPEGAVGGLFLRLYNLLSEYFIPLTCWTIMFFFIYLWRNGYLLEIHGRIEDAFRSNRTAGYTPDNYKDTAPRSAALMGAATSNFSDRQLSARDAAFIDLSVFALQMFNQNTNIVIVSQMGLTSEYYRSIHTRISQQLNSASQSVPEMARPILRDAGGNYDLPSKLLSDLCAVAIKSGNTDRWTRVRLEKVAKHLKQPKSFIAEAFYGY